MRTRVRCVWLTFVCAVVIAVACVSPVAGADYYLHTEGSDTLDQASPTPTGAKFKDSPPVNRTVYQAIGTWTAAPVDRMLRLDSLGDVRLWVA